MSKLKTDESLLAGISSGISRRKFFGLAGGVTAAGLFVASCNDDDDLTPEPVIPDEGIDLGSGDVGILNYAYALEQLEAAFYTKVIESQYSNMPGTELALLTDIRDHEVAHREFFKAALTAAAPGSIIPGLEVDFSSIDFGSRTSVLATAKAFEDLGVSAYNGAGKLLITGEYLLLAGKIVSVEARHAAYIRDLISNGSFADSTVVDANGLDMSRDPAAVLDIAKTFLKSKLNASNLPTS
jgi:hypothetical protein